GPRFAVEPAEVTGRAEELGYECRANSPAWVNCTKDDTTIDAIQSDGVLYRIMVEGEDGAESSAADQLAEFVDLLFDPEAAEEIRAALGRVDGPGVEMAAGFLISVHPGTVRILRITIW